MSNKLIPAKDALKVVSFGLASIRETTHGIRKSLGKDIRRARKAKVDKRNFFQRAWDAARKKNTEGLIESKQKKSFIGGSVESISQGKDGFFNKVVKAVGWLLIGYLGQKIPQLIENIKKVFAVIQSLSKFIGTFVGDVINIGKTLVGLIGEFVKQIKEFNFDKAAIEQKFKEFTGSIDTLGKNWDENYAALTDSIEQFRKDGEKAVAEELSKPQTEALIQLQQKRDSGEMTEKEYKEEVIKLYKPYGEDTDGTAILVDPLKVQEEKNLSDRKTMSANEFFGTFEHADTDDKDLTLNDQIDTSDDSSDDTSSVDVNYNVDLTEQKGEVKLAKTSNVFKAQTIEQYTGPAYTHDQHQQMIADGRNAKKTNFYFNKVIAYNKLLYPGTSGNYVQIGDGPRLAPGDEGYVEAFAPVDSSKLISSANNGRDVNNLKSNEGKVVTVPINVGGSNLNNSQSLASSNGSSSSSVIIINSNKNSLKNIRRLERHYT